MDDIVYVSTVVVLLIISSGFFSGSETGLTAASRAKIHKLSMEGNKRAILVSKLRDNKERIIGAILLGNNAVNILASALATGIAIELFGDDGVMIAAVTMTALVLVFAEVLPKTYAFNHAEKVALLVAPVINILVKFLAPITGAVQAMVNMTLRIFSFGKAKHHEIVSGEEALRGAIALHHKEGAVVTEYRNMLESILDLGEREVHEVMVHRKEMMTLNLSQPSNKLIEQILNAAHTRIPIWEDDPDNVVGVLHVKEVVKLIQKKGPKIQHTDIKQIAAEPWFIPENTSLNAQLSAFRQRRYHFALVVDEYGALQGVVTLEDILEEIVGEIEDEHDAIELPFTRLKDGSYIVEGKTSLRDLNRHLDWELNEEEAVTIAGLVMNEAETIPDVGEVFKTQGWRFEVLGKEGNQLTSIKVRAVMGRGRDKDDA